MTQIPTAQQKKQLLEFLKFYNDFSRDLDRLIQEEEKCVAQHQRHIAELRARKPKPL